MKLVLFTVEHLVLTGLPLAAAALFAARRGVKQLPLLLAIGLAASGLVGLLGFWTYYADRIVGETFSYLVLFGSILLVVSSLWGGRIEPALLRRLATPLALWAFGSAFLLFLGFAHGGTEVPILTSTARFSHPLPTDSEIPRFFAEWFYAHGHGGKAPIFPGEWLSSDRPPLQAGYFLSQRPFGGDAAGLHYQVLGVVLQQLWIIGVWALLVAAGIGRVTRALTMGAVLVSGLAIVNGFFVWPKLLPAAMLLAVAALVLTPLWAQLRNSLWAAALIAALCGIAMLGHGSSVFGVVPLAVVAAYRGMPSWRWLAVGLVVGIAFMAPWSAYQRNEDPPGNRLAKWTLAGVVEIDDRGTSETIVDAYREAGIGGTLDNKAHNFTVMTTGGRPALDAVESAVRSGDLGQMGRTARVISFYYLLPSLWLLLLAPFAMLVARGRGHPAEGAEWSFALTCFIVLAVGAVAWGLLAFGNQDSETIIHVSSYLLPVLGICGCAVGLRAVLPRAALCIVGLNMLLTLLVYAPALDSPPGTAYMPLTFVLALASLVGFAAVALRGDGPNSPAGGLETAAARPGPAGVERQPA